MEHLWARLEHLPGMNIRLWVGPSNIENKKEREKINTFSKLDY